MKPSEHKHTDECLEYAAKTGKAFCIAECKDSYELGDATLDTAKEAIDNAGWMYVLATNELKETDDDYLYRFYLGVKMGMRLILTLVEPEKKDRESWRLLIETSHQYIYLSESILDALPGDTDD